MRKFKIFKKGITTEYLIWLLIAVVLLVILSFMIYLFKEKGVGLIERIKTLLH